MKLSISKNQKLLMIILGFRRLHFLIEKGDMRLSQLKIPSNFFFIADKFNTRSLLAPLVVTWQTLLAIKPTNSIGQFSDNSLMTIKAVKLQTIPFILNVHNHENGTVMMYSSSFL